MESMRYGRRLAKVQEQRDGLFPAASLMIVPTNARPWSKPGPDPDPDADVEWVFEFCVPLIRLQLRCGWLAGWLAGIISSRPFEQDSDVSQLSSRTVQDGGVEPSTYIYIYIIECRQLYFHTTLFIAFACAVAVYPRSLPTDLFLLSVLLAQDVQQVRRRNGWTRPPPGTGEARQKSGLAWPYGLC